MRQGIAYIVGSIVVMIAGVFAAEVLESNALAVAVGLTAGYGLMHGGELIESAHKRTRDRGLDE